MNFFGTKRARERADENFSSGNDAERAENASHAESCRVQETGREGTCPATAFAVAEEVRALIGET